MFQGLTDQVLNQFIQLNNLNNPNLPRHQPRFPYRTLGHLVVLPVGSMVYGIDPVNHRVLWRHNLAAQSGGPTAANPSPPTGPQGQQQPLVDPRDGSVLVVYPDGWAQRLGTTGPLEGQVIYAQVRDTLTALDPLTGRTLWSRSDVTSRNRFIFADEEHVFVVELDNGNNPHASRIFRSADGISVKAPDFSALFQKRLHVFGRCLLLSESGTANTVTLRLYDPLTGQDLWKHAYPSRSLVARSEDPRFTGVVEPDGNVHVIDLKTRKEVMTGKLAEPAKDLLNVQTIHLLTDDKNFYFTCQAPMEGNNFNRSGLLSNVNTQLGMRTVLVNGMIYAFNRGSGEAEWYLHVKNQMLLLDQFQELPVVLLTARHQELRNHPNGGQQWVQIVSAMSIEKRSGSVLFEDEKLKNATNFWGVRVDARAGTVDFLSPNQKIAHFPKAIDAGKAAKTGDKHAAEQTSTTPQSQPVGGSLKRTTIDRVRIREIANPPSPD
jgi:outer membrane protein assembly factor BamB